MDLSNLKNMSSLLNASGQGKNVVNVELSKISSRPQVRADGNAGFEYESLQQLSDSIKAIGVQQPIILRPDPEHEGHYIIVCGERRYRASKLAETETVPAIIREDLTDDREIMIVQITENIQREDISNIEIAAAAKQLLNMGMKAIEVADKLGKPSSAISDYVRMLEMPPFLMNLLADGILSSSPRTCAEYSRLYEENPILLEKYINEYIEQEIHENNDKEKPILDRSIIKQFRHYISDETKPKSTEDSDMHTETETENTRESEVEESSYNESEYPDKEEHEKSDTPKMFAKNQESNAPTAGVNATSSYTDRDTRVEHDLSDSVARSEEHNDYNSDDEPDSETEDDTDNQESSDDSPIIIQSLLVEYEGMIYHFDLEQGHDTNHVMITDKEGVSREAMLSDLKFLKVLR